MSAERPAWPRLRRTGVGRGPARLGRNDPPRGCLGERAAALADGELGDDARDLALAHLAVCDACRAEVSSQRHLKQRLRGLDDLPLPEDLTARLLGIAGSNEPDDPTSHRPGPYVAAGGLRGAASRGPGRGRSMRPGSGRSGAGVGATRPGAARHRRRTGVRIVVGGGIGVLALSVSAFVLGAPQQPAVVPAADQFSIEHASTTHELPFNNDIPAITRAVPAGFSFTTSGP